MVNLELWKHQKKELRLSLQDIADRSGVSISTLKDIFRGATTDPRIETVQRIERALGLGVQQNAAASDIELLALLQQMTEEEIQQLSAFVDFIVSQRNKRKQ